MELVLCNLRQDNVDCSDREQCSRAIIQVASPRVWSPLDIESIVNIQEESIASILPIQDMIVAKGQ